MSKLSEIKEKLIQLKPILSDKFFVNDIGLFGSIVRDDFTEHSDIDIIVDFSKSIGVEFIDLAIFLEHQLHAKIDLVSKKGIKPQYLLAIQPEIIYV